MEAFEHCLELVTRTTYENNQRFLRYFERLSTTGYMTCQAFATSDRSCDALWFTPEIRADVQLLRVTCRDPGFVTGIKRILLGGFDPEEIYTRIASALYGRGMLCAASHANE